METSGIRQQIEQQGFAVLPVYPPYAVQEILLGLNEALAKAGAASSIRSRNGHVYAARNLLSLYPAVTEIWHAPLLLTLLRETLGENCGLVRGLYFDKHPDSPWALPWHKDMTIAVARNDLPSQRFSNPTTKAGVQHVEAPCDVLEQMLTLRIHLDRVTGANGPLKVIPGSHLRGKQTDDEDSQMHTITCGKGDVLAMRPLLSHSSGESDPGPAAHRRVIHLEFAGCQTLDDGYAWHQFIPLPPD